MKFFQFKLVIPNLSHSFFPYSSFLFSLLSPMLLFQPFGVFLHGLRPMVEFVVSPHYSSFFLFILSIALVKIYCVIVAENASVNKGGPCILGTCQLFDNIDL